MGASQSGTPQNSGIFCSQVKGFYEEEILVLASQEQREKIKKRKEEENACFSFSEHDQFYPEDCPFCLSWKRDGKFIEGEIFKYRDKLQEIKNCIPTQLLLAYQMKQIRPLTLFTTPLKRVVEGCTMCSASYKKFEDLKRDLHNLQTDVDNAETFLETHNINLPKTHTTALTDDASVVYIPKNIRKYIKPNWMAPLIDSTINEKHPVKNTISAASTHDEITPPPEEPSIYLPSSTVLQRKKMGGTHIAAIREDPL